MSASALTLAVALALGAPPAPTRVEPLRPLAELSPLARRLADDMRPLPDAALFEVARQLEGRLLLDATTSLVETVSELELSLRLAVVAQLLGARPLAPELIPEARRLARVAAFVTYLNGHAYTSDADVRASVEAVLPRPDDPRRPVFDELVATVQAGRAYGDRWFREAVAADDRRRPSAAALAQEGIWHWHEGRLPEAVDALSRSLAEEPSEPVLLQTYEALLTLGSAEALTMARALRDPSVARWPELAARFDDLDEMAADARATALFEARPPDDVALAAAQVERYTRMGRGGAAELLAQATLERHGDAPEAWHARAELLYQLDRAESLRVLLADAEARGRFDTRLREVRVAACVRARARASLGEVRHALADADLDGDLAAIVAAGGGAGSDADRMARGARVLLAMVAWRGGRDTPAAPGLLAAAEAELQDLAKALPKDPEALRLLVVGWAGLEQAGRGVEIVAKLATKLPAPARAPVDLLVARLEAGLGFRERDPRRLTSALTRLARLDGERLAAAERTAWLQARATAELGAVALQGARPSAKQLAAARAALAPLRWDESRYDGRLDAQAGRLVLATIAHLEAAPDEAAQLGAARAARRDDELAYLAGGLRQLLLADRQGAFELWQRGLPSASRPEVRQWLLAGSAWALAPYEPVVAQGWARQGLELWEAARLLPDAPASVRPLLVGDFQIDLELTRGAPMRLALRADPALTLVPELVASREELTRLLGPR